MELPANIGRFHIIRELGRGSQGVVYLASDPHLEREVAIKTLHMHLSKDGEKQKRLMREARTVSKLQHPNIIPLYEAGDYKGKPYLVFEYVEGTSLGDFIKSNGLLIIHHAVKLMRQILDGIATAHQQGVVHRDMSPSNILISKKNVPRIMDFGISIMTQAETSADRDLAGTPCYMSPEHFSKKPIGPRSDIFSLGLIFYEMLTGHSAIEGDNHFAVMYKIAHEHIEKPSLKNQKVDNKLDRIILKAVEIELDSRYADALEMQKDLDEYLDVKETNEMDRQDQGDTHVTLDFLLQRMRHKRDFPAFSQYIIEINQKASSKDMNYTSASQLSNVILKDYALTNKLLKLVNSAFYGQFAGTVNTVSRAVVVLGFDQVRLAATSLILFEHLQNSAQSMELKDAAIGSLLSGMFAKGFAERLELKITEESFICAMLHNLGKHLVIFYFPEEYDQIMNLMAQKGIDEKAASRSILGISYDDLGTGTARTWKFPENIVRSMKNLPKGKVGRPKSEGDMLCNLSSFSNELCNIASNMEGKDYEKTLTALLRRFEDSFSVSMNQISILLDSARDKANKYLAVLNINIKKSKFLNQVARHSRSQDQKPSADDSKFELIEETLVLETTEISPGPGELKDPQSILINGIQEITNTLLDDYEFNDVLTMIMETIYRGFGFRSVLFCLTDIKRTRMNARFGFGEGIDDLIENFHFKINNSPDVFNLALSHAKDLGIDDTKHPAMEKGIPEWYLRVISAPAFVLYPIIINKAPVGLIYADREKAGRILSGDQINYMKTLCNQAVLAMKQMRQKS